jgi:tRNA pseudouridine55 synthase
MLFLKKYNGANLDSGIYIVNKKKGKSSFDIVKKFKKKACDFSHNDLIFGHGGTLDPFAEGLLLILAGQATRLMNLINVLPKTYLAKINWGTETDTCDYLGNIVANGILPTIITQDSLTTFIGWNKQVPPSTCAKKINGEAAYKKAHRGEIIILPPSDVYLYEAHWVSHDLPKSSILSITCKGGYYVRGLARDLGRNLTCKAHLSALIRTNIGPWSVPNLDKTHLMQGQELAPWCSLRVLTKNEFSHIKCGKTISLGDIKESAWSRPINFPNFNQPIIGIYDTKLVALMREKDDLLHAHVNLRNGI